MITHKLTERKRHHPEGTHSTVCGLCVEQYQRADVAGDTFIDRRKPLVWSEDDFDCPSCKRFLRDHKGKPVCIDKVAMGTHLWSGDDCDRVYCGGSIDECEERGIAYTVAISEADCTACIDAAAESFRKSAEASLRLSGSQLRLSKRFTEFQLILEDRLVKLYAANEQEPDELDE